MMVSVVMPSYNSEKYIREAVESVIGQSWKAWEVLVVDDGSTDRTPEIVRSISVEDSRVRLLINERNLGAAASRNRAIEAARGRYIAFLDSDDVWHPTKLSRQVAFMERTRCGLSYTAYEKMAEDGTRQGRIVNVPLAVTYDQLLGHAAIGCLTAMYDTEVVGKVCLPDIARRQDHGLWLRILRQGVTARGLNEPLAYLRIRSGSLSSNKIQASRYLWRLYRDHEHVPLRKRVVKFAEYALRSGTKYFK